MTVIAENRIPPGGTRPHPSGRQKLRPVPSHERPAAVHTVTVSPISGPQGCLVAPTAASCAHYHLAPLDASLRVPFVAPALAGMRCFLSLDNLRAFQSSLSGRPATLTRWYERGVADAERFAAEHAPPET